MEFAVIKLNGKQFIVKKGDLLTVDRVNLETPITVLAFSNDEGVELDLDKLSNIGVELEIMKEMRSAKIQVRRYKSKSRYRKNKTHRQDQSVLKVTGLGGKGSSKIVANKGKPKAEKSEEATKKAPKAEKATKADS